MPGSIREYNYTIKPEVEDLARAAGQARRVLGWACDGDKRITCYGVKGDALGVLQMSFTVRARDQWYSRELAQDILNMVTWGLANKAEVQLQSERLPPHEMRGYLYGRTKRWRERSSSSSTSAA
jgi:hypothetical protein